MTKDLLVSVIIPFLNTEPYLQEAIESVLAQTYQNWELILVDDGSIDKSTDIALRYSTQFPPQIQYREHSHHQNLGRSATRNLGIQYAQGNYLIFLDSDDVWMPYCLETLIDTFNRHPEVNAVYGNTLYWHTWSQTSKNEDFCDHVAELTHRPNTSFSPLELLTLFLNDGNSVPCICSLMVTRGLMEELGGFEESFRGLYDDQVFYAKVGLKATVFVTSECLSKYRQRPDSCCAISLLLNEQKPKRFLWLVWLEAYLTNHHQTRTDAWSILQDELFSYRSPRLYKLKRYIQNSRYRLKQHLKFILRFSART